MKKSLLVGLVALAATGVAFADGFYVGVGVGATGMHDKVGVNDVGANNDGNFDTGNIGATGGLFAGYMLNYPSQFNFGIEVFGNATSTKITNSEDATGQIVTKERYNYGVRVLPGYAMTPDTSAHVLLGYVRGNFKITDSGYAASGVSDTFNANGYQIGLGSSTNMTKNVALRGDLIYTGYQSKTITATAGDSYNNKIQTLDGVVSLAYKFG